MKRNILFVFILMLLCVVGITTLQLYYSYVNYGIAKKEFDKNANEAFAEAIDSAFSVRRQNTVATFGKWMRDESFVIITSRWDEKEQATIFKFKEVFNKVNPEPREFNFSLRDFTKKGEKIDAITPEAKEYAIKQMEGSVLDGLKKDIIHFYTQGIGDRLSKLYYDTPIDAKVIEREYRRALGKRGIDLSFELAEGKKCSDGLSTKEYNIDVNSGERWVSACFKNTSAYLLGQLKWVIAGSMLLIIITFCCFWYTIRILLSQHKLNEMKDDFISNMTHEIHSPLASVIVTAESLNKFEHDAESRANYLDIILYQSKKLTALADDILAGAKLEKKGIELRDSIDLDKLLSEAVSGYRNQAAIDCSIVKRIILKGNYNHLSRAIGNLLDNAVKYNTAENPKIAVKSFANNKEITISIADNGAGIPDAFKTKVFDQFYRIPTGNVHNVKGYGLGLSYVKKVIQAHGGSIWVKENTPSGSIFIIKLPYEA